MNSKQLIITLLADNMEQYRAFHSADQAYAEYLSPLTEDEKKALNKSFEKDFKHYWSKICNENVLENLEHPISLDLARYRTKGAITQSVKANYGVPAAAPTELVIRTVNTANFVIPPAMFKRYNTGTIFDELHSDDGGFMAACSIVIVGGPGVGKSTLTFWAASRLKEMDQDIRVAVVSSEMEIEDLLYEAQRKPWMNTIDFILTSEYQETLKEALKKIFLGGYHIIILDSFADICDKLRDFCGMTTSAAETWLLDLMKAAKGGKNSEVDEEKVYTTTLAIQQQTKSGSFAGSNKLKHNTTAMLELRKEKSGDRYMVYTKNRRNGAMVGKRMFYYLGAGNQVSFDQEKWENEKQDGYDQHSAAASETLSQAALANFDQLNEEAIARLNAAMQQNGAADAINGATTESAPGGRQAELLAAAYLDNATGQWTLEANGTIYLGPSDVDVVDQAMNDIAPEAEDTNTTEELN